MLSQECTRRVQYIYSDQYQEYCDKLPSNLGRSTLMHALVKSYGLFEKMVIRSPFLGTKRDFEIYHSSELTNLLLSFDQPNKPFGSDSELAEFGLLYDCPIFPGLTEYSRYLVGSAIASAELLLDEEAEVVINWDGGRHHAKHNAASGFCYVNDVVISILRLSEDFEKVMYIDLDLHHGDGVEEAFYYTPNVLTVSLHRHDPGFFPGTGFFSNQGKGRGLHHALNLPLRPGLNDQNLQNIFDKVIQEAYEAYQPNSIVVQCGADGLVGDRHREWNLTLQGFSYCLDRILSWNLPTLVLGGGGYNHPNTARCYAQLTSVALESPILNFTPESSSADIPEHNFFCEYLPDYKLQVTPSPQKDENTEEYLTKIIESARLQIQKLS